MKQFHEIVYEILLGRLKIIMKITKSYYNKISTNKFNLFFLINALNKKFK
jgi:hypothetical protein